MKRKVAYLQITRKCNNECIFCSNPIIEGDMQFEEIAASVNELKKEGVSEIILTGGEPTLCEFLFEVISFIRKEGIGVKMITNGVLLSDAGIVKKLRDSGLSDINISIHSHKREIAAKLSQKEGNWDKAVEGIKNCIKNGINININSTINSENFRELPSFAEFAVSSFPEVNHYVFNGLDPGNADGHHKSRAGENPWLVPKISDAEIYLKKACEILQKHKKSFRVERIPLCYMDGIEEFSTETRKIVKDESYICSFIVSPGIGEIRKVSPGMLREKAECCGVCKLNSVCAGAQKEYFNIHGKGEIYPVFKEPKRIIKKIKGYADVRG